MEISDNLLCVFSAEISEQRDSYVIEVPKREVVVGDVHPGVHKVALLSGVESDQEESDQKQTEPDPTPTSYESSGPPVAEGETLRVEIEDLGEKGDGIARVDRGYVIIVPDAEKGERVVVEVNTVKANVAFADVVERIDYYE